MQLDGNYQTLSPQQGWPHEREQDFWKGAKELNSLHPAFSTPPSSSVFSEHFDEFMGCDGLEAFSHVILPSAGQFGPEDLFQDVEDTSLPGNNFNDISFSSMASPQSVNEISKPKLTIKLKKVKYKKQPKSISLYSFHSPDFEVVSSTPQTNVFAKINELEGSISPQSVTETDFHSGAINIDNISNVSPPLTLKDALKMEDADIILKNYLSLDSHMSQDMTSEYLNISSWEDDTQSLASESSGLPSSESSFLLSPYYSRDMTASSPQEPDHASDRKRSSSQRSKKRQKLTPESRYLRKKEQNKQAALRYRAKKKEEEEHVQNSLKAEQQQREQLQKTYSNLKQEISFIKKLTRETLITNKLVPPNAFN